MGLTYAPEAATCVNRLPAWLNRSIGLASLIVIAGYLIWLLPPARHRPLQGADRAAERPHAPCADRHWRRGSRGGRRRHVQPASAAAGNRCDRVIGHFHRCIAARILKPCAWKSGRNRSNDAA